MIKKPDVKKALETVMGYELTEDTMQLIDLFASVASYERTDVPGNFVTRMSLIVHRPPTCEQYQGLLDVSGWWLTGSDGRSVFRLTSFICYEAPPFIYPPVTVVVTPTSSEPRFATVLHSLVKNDKDKAVDVEMQVFTWGANGAPAPNTSFNWRCRVPIQGVLL